MLEQGLVISCPLFSSSLFLFISLFRFSLSPYPLIQNSLLILEGLGLTHQFPFQVCSLLKSFVSFCKCPLTYMIPFNSRCLQTLGPPFPLREEHHNKQPLTLGGNFLGMKLEFAVSFHINIEFKFFYTTCLSLHGFIRGKKAIH